MTALTIVVPVVVSLCRMTALTILSQVVALDGDGAMLMHMGALSTLGQRAPINFRHIVFNNGAHDSVGGQPTAAGHHDRFSVTGVASACGYREVGGRFDTGQGSHGSSTRPGPTTKTTLENKAEFNRFLST
ncbi:hypothetical protein ACOMHN_010775 [Nucella lapillus]